jgi:serine/threonine protein kinase
VTPLQRKVLVDDGGVAKICGFGLVRLVPESRHTGVTTASAHTGTIRYLSYERVSHDVDDTMSTTASDVYALACVGMEVSIFLFYLCSFTNSLLSSFTGNHHMHGFQIQHSMLSSRY